MNEIKNYLNIVEQIKTSDKEKEALNFILNGFALCTDLLEKERQENKQLKEQLQQKDNIINKAKEYLNGVFEMATYTKSLILDADNIEELLEILDNKGE